MENLDLTVLRQLRDWRRAGKATLLATVTRTWGSSPRPVGSIMALCEGGAVVGSVSGGCIEDDLIHHWRDALQDGPPQRTKYGVSADDAHRFGLPCGGTLELLLEFNSDAATLEDLVDRLSAGHMVLRSTEIATGRVLLTGIAQPEVLREQGDWLHNAFGPEYRLLMIGAGQLTEYLATMALFSGFSVTVCDPREEYRGAWQVPGVTLTTEMPDDVVRAFRADRRTAVVALTHDPKLDDLALLEALETDAFYIGAIGSRRNQQLRHARLIEHFEQTDESLARLRGPIGIYIGSKTPAEIAVSVMAELLAVKNRVPLPRDLAVGPAKDLLALDEHAAQVCGALPTVD
ncbi:XdhC family protein (plasmid) [Alicycliphilus denitrificans]|uniref:XdhC family protein n=1 Tax=Alicycliphilus denitrificans TaxID=179636 RepID=A0A858ZMX9_9BURK|nr:XdhC family protein [Alicycliphilus denitrificans]QKD42088.1 XdhC family protein [Alicycliphilus denitrificans]QKD42116.1 XdhC family protein [Alicycliphilus denitrificans]